MIDLKDLECVLALARHRHFARAAQACGLSQPAFSMRIRNLEASLNTSIVKRGNRFQQFTPEGEKVLIHAREILEKADAMEQDVRGGRGALSGVLVLGVVPTAVAFAARIAIWLKADHAGLTTRIIAAPSLTILQGIDEGQFDAGLTYSEGVPADLMQMDPLYDEEYVLVAPRGMVDPNHAEITWAEAAALPLTLLEPAMQNRRIIDQIFESVGAAPEVVSESNGFNASLVMARAGVAATVVPRVLIEELTGQDSVSVLSLVDPVAEKPVSLIMPRQGAASPVLTTLRDVVMQNL